MSASRIAQVHRTYADEDGLHVMWKSWDDAYDRLTGRRMIDGDGVVFIEVEHTWEQRGFWMKNPPRVMTELQWYAPDQIRYFVDESPMRGPEADFR